MSKAAPRDGNFVPSALFEISGSPGQVYPGQINQVTGRILVDVSGSSSLNFQDDLFTATDNQTVFSASKTVTATIYLAVNGALQSNGTDYTVSGNTATLAVGIPAGSLVDWYYITP